MLIQIHMLQNYAPSNLNRDETGSPKDTVFGGVKRGRISSQCLKRSIRRSSVFQDAFADSGMLATRTKRLPSLIDEALLRLEADESTRRDIVKRVPEIGKKDKKQSEDGDDTETPEATAGETDGSMETRQLIFIGADEAQKLAEQMLALHQKHGSKGFAKLKINDELRSNLPRSVDIAMFGRMTTSAAFQDVQAAVQVAHAISTNAVVQEFDYFTAVDDISGQTGAGMIGDVEYNSSNYYKYLNLHWEQLVHNLSGDTEAAVRAVLALVEAATIAQPSGKQNSFAANNLPDLVLVEVSRRNVPVSYANAFVKPVRQRGEQSLVDGAAAALGSYMGRLNEVYGLAAECCYFSTGDHALPNAEKAGSLAALLQWVEHRLPVEGVVRG